MIPLESYNDCPKQLSSYSLLTKSSLLLKKIQLILFIVMEDSKFINAITITEAREEMVQGGVIFFTPLPLGEELIGFIMVGNLF